MSQLPIHRSSQLSDFGVYLKSVVPRHRHLRKDTLSPILTIIISLDS